MAASYNKRIERLEAWAREKEARRTAARLSQMTDEELLEIVAEGSGRQPEEIADEDLWALVRRTREP